MLVEFGEMPSDDAVEYRKLLIFKALFLLNSSAIQPLPHGC